MTSAEVLSQFVTSETSRNGTAAPCALRRVALHTRSLYRIRVYEACTLKTCNFHYLSIIQIIIHSNTKTFRSNFHSNELKKIREVPVWKVSVGKKLCGFLYKNYI